MQSWFKAVRPDWIIQDAFEAVWFQNGGPVRAALFGKWNPRESTNEFYFTPEAAQLDPALLARFGATPCERPDLSQPSLLGPFLLVGEISC
jgi:hypothetical protein